MGPASSVRVQGVHSGILKPRKLSDYAIPVQENYGFGWVLQTTKVGDAIVWHNVSNTMWYALLHRMPEKDVAISVTTNAYAPNLVDDMVRELSA